MQEIYKRRRERAIERANGTYRDRRFTATKPRAEVRRDWKILNYSGTLHRAARRRAKRDGLEFTITPEDIKIPTHCPVLGVPMRMARGRADDYSATVDRIVNTEGYTPGNIVVISRRANHLKSDATLLEIQQLAKFYARWI